ncbi:uncharacterized protein UDID_18887 [Ustilago sp. UG-2017a]|nr:uncharacterized protein UDID_18887 [Ustilago sp. UG-2017a]
MTERSKPIATPFPKFNPRDMEIFILEAEAWFKFNQVYEQSRMINHMGAQLEGNACKWWTSKLRINRAQEGRLFKDWHYFTERLTEQFNPRNARMEAYNKLLALRLTSDAPGVATRHLEQFRDLEGQVNLDDNELVIDLIRGSLTHSLQEKFERNPPRKRWEWYREQASARHSQANNAVQFPFSDRLRNLIQLDHRLNLINCHNLTRPDHPPKTFLTQITVLFPINPLQLRKEPRHHQEAATTPVMVVTKDPFEETTDSGDGHSGNTELEQEDMDLSPYQQHTDPDHEEEQDDDDDKGNVRKAVLELSGMVQNHPARILADTSAGLSIVSDSFISKYQIPTKPTKTRSIHGVTGHQLSINSSASMQVSIGTHNLGVVEASVADTADYDLILGFTELRKLKPTIQWDTGQLEFKTQEQDRPPKRPPEAARAGDLSMRRPTLHGNEFVSAERILQAALEDGPIGFMLLEEPPSSLPAFGFVPTGADKGVEMEVEVDKVVMAADIPKPYQHLRDVFDEVEADKLPQHTEHDLHLKLIEGGKPPQGPLYLKGPREMSELRKYLDENLEKGFIRPLKSPAQSPVLFVPKKDGGLRLCVDYQGLNKITVKNRAPLPLIEEQLFLLRKARIYTKLDLRAAYNLIRIAKGDEWKTAFGTQLGLYEYLVMPFSLANAPAHFQSFINDIFRDIIGVYVVVYLDDFLIFILTRLRSNRLFAKLSKCEFHTKTVEFLGYIIKPTGIEMDPGKVRTVKEWPMPASIHDIQRFLGFANFYRRFIAHFTWIAKPLTSLVKPTECFKKFDSLHTMTIGQSGYIDQVLAKHLDKRTKPTMVPMQSIPEGTIVTSAVQQKEYLVIVGKLLWVANSTRPDLSLTVGVLARHMHKPSQEHYQAAQRVLRYLESTKEVGLVYRANESQEPLVAHSDANWASDATIQRRSTSGSVALVYGNPVAWKSATQKCVSLSAVEAEFIAATEATREVLFLKQLLCSIGIATGTPTVYSDNTGCIQVSKDPAQHWKLKHINTTYHFVRNNIHEGRVQIKYVDTTRNLADILTKPIGRQAMQQARSGLHLQILAAVYETGSPSYATVLKNRGHTLKQQHDEQGTYAVEGGS